MLFLGQSERLSLSHLAEDRSIFAKGAVRVIRVSSAPEAGATLGKDFEVQGRIDLALLKASLPFDDYDFYLCGPQPFMQTLYDGLRSLRVMDESIHFENFGPASVQRNIATGAASLSTTPSSPKVWVTPEFAPQSQPLTASVRVASAAARIR